MTNSKRTMGVMAMTVWRLRHRIIIVGMCRIHINTLEYKGAHLLQGSWPLRISMGTCTMRKESVMSCKALTCSR